MFVFYVIPGKTWIIVVTFLSILELADYMLTQIIGMDAFDYVPESTKDSDPYRRILMSFLGSHEVPTTKYLRQAYDCVSDKIDFLEDYMLGLMYIQSARSEIKRKGLSEPTRVKVLLAHGRVKDGTYIYGDVGPEGGVIKQPMEDWIAQNETEYDALVLDSCNGTLDHSEGPTRLEPRESTTLLYPPNLNNHLFILLAQLGFRKKPFIIVPPTSKSP